MISCTLTAQRGYLMKRRELIVMLGGAAMARALPTAAQQPKRLPVIALVAASGPVADLVASDPISTTAR